MLPEPAPGPPQYDECPVDGCENSEDLDVIECAPGYTWLFTSTVCGHVVWVYWRPYAEYGMET